MDDGLIVGVVEVTVDGEKKNIQVIEENNGRALLPVLSNIAVTLKPCSKRWGSRSGYQASATSLGR